MANHGQTDVVLRAFLQSSSMAYDNEISVSSN
jgi:hypothetical protein